MMSLYSWILESFRKGRKLGGKKLSQTSPCYEKETEYYNCMKNIKLYLEGLWIYNNLPMEKKSVVKQIGSAVKTAQVQIPTLSSICHVTQTRQSASLSSGSTCLKWDKNRTYFTKSLCANVCSFIEKCWYVVCFTCFQYFLKTFLTFQKTQRYFESVFY